LPQAESCALLDLGSSTQMQRRLTVLCFETHYFAKHQNVGSNLIPTMKVLLNKGQNSSHATNLNYVAVSGKTYIIDNHLAAIWCMSQLDVLKRYNFLHIDRHYDLSPYNSERHSKIKSIDLKNLPIDDLTSFRTTVDRKEFQLVTWDNYINLFNEKFPDTIDQTIFITQKKGDFNYKKEYKHLEIYELFTEIFETENKWIFNIDLDYFFTTPVDTTIQMFTDEFIEEFALWLKGEYKNAELIIFCLSPECCGGWDKAQKILDIIKSHIET
jgi:hypothetical protein